MKLRNTAIAIGVAAATAAGLSLLKVDKLVLIGSTAVVAAGGFMVAGKKADELSADEYLVRGKDKRENGDQEGSIDDFTKAIEIDPKCESAYCELADIKWFVGDKSGAISDYSKAIKINPRNAASYFYRGMAKDYLEDYQGAICDYSKAIEIDPKDESYYYWRGKSKNKSQDLQGALIDWHKAAELGCKDASKMLKESSDYKDQLPVDSSKKSPLDPNPESLSYVAGFSPKGELTVRREYNELLDLRPGDIFKILLGRYEGIKQIRLVASGPEEFEDFDQTLEAHKMKSAIDLDLDFEIEVNENLDLIIDRPYTDLIDLYPGDELNILLGRYGFVLNHIHKDNSNEDPQLDQNIENTYDSKQSNIFTSGDSAETHAKRLNNLLLEFWEFTPFLEDNPVPVCLASKNEDESINISFCGGTLENKDYSKKSCFYRIDQEGMAHVKESNEVLNLNDLHQIYGIIYTIIADMYGEYDGNEVMEKLTNNKNQSEDNTLMLVDLVGGEENYGKLIAWAGENLEQQDIAEFDQVLESGDIEKCKDNVLKLKDLYESKGNDYSEVIAEDTSLTEDDIQMLQNLVGGEENYGKLIAWAGENLEQQDIAEFDQVLESGDIEKCKDNVLKLKDLYESKGNNNLSNNEITADDFIQKAYAKLDNRDPQGAIKNFTRAIEMLGTLEPELFKFRGNAKRDLGEFDSARLDWKMAAENGDKEASLMLEVYLTDKQLDVNTKERLLEEEFMMHVMKYRGLSYDELVRSCGYFSRDVNGKINIEYILYEECILDSLAHSYGINLKKSSDDFSDYMHEHIEMFYDDTREFRFNAIQHFATDLKDLENVRDFLETVNGLNKVKDLQKVDWEFIRKWREENLYSLFGGYENFWDLVLWSIENLRENERQYLDQLSKSGYPLYMQYAWAKVKRIQEEREGVEETLYEDWRLNMILSQKRVLHAIWDKQSHEEYNNLSHTHTYTSGNYLQENPVPELLTFFTYVETNHWCLNQISELLLTRKIHPLQEGEIREVIGIVGENCEVPIRLKLLSEEDRKSANKEYTTQISVETPLILVDIPDLKSRFSNEDNCDSFVKDKIPEQFRVDNYTTTQEFPLTNLPVSIDAFYVALNVTMDGLRAKNEMSAATFSTVCRIIDNANPELYPLIDYFDLIELKKETTDIESLKEWVELDDEFYANNDTDNVWNIGDNESCDYRDEESFLSDLNYDMVNFIVQRSWESCQSEEKMKELRHFKKLFDDEYRKMKTND